MKIRPHTKPNKAHVLVVLSLLWGVFFFTGLFFSMLATEAHASSLLYQSDKSTSNGSGFNNIETGENWVCIDVADIPSNTLTKFSLAFTIESAGTIRGRMLELDDVCGMGGTLLHTHNVDVAVSSGSAQTVEFEFTLPVTLDNATQAVVFGNGTGSGICPSGIFSPCTIWGANGTPPSWYNNAVTYNLDMYYFQLFGTTGPPPSSQISNVIAPASPTTGGASGAVQFEFDFISSTPVLANACIFLTNVTAQQQVVPTCVAVTQSGNLTFDENITLNNNTLYTWRAVLLDSNNFIVDQTAIRYYEAGTSAPQSPLFPEVDFTATTTATTTSVFFFSSLPNLLQGIPPWSYIIQIRNTIVNVTDNFTDGELPETTITMASSTPLQFSFIFLDEDSITGMTGTIFWDSLKLIIAGVIWIHVALMTIAVVQRRMDVS